MRKRKREKTILRENKQKELKKNQKEEKKQGCGKKQNETVQRAKISSSN